jgi:hypothetical protein
MAGQDESLKLAVEIINRASHREHQDGSTDTSILFSAKHCAYSDMPSFSSQSRSPALWRTLPVDATVFPVKIIRRTL